MGWIGWKGLFWDGQSKPCPCCTQVHQLRSTPVVLATLAKLHPLLKFCSFFKCYFYFSFFQVKKLEVDKEKLEKKNEEIASKLACSCSRSNARSDWLTLGHCSPVMSTGWLVLSTSMSVLCNEWNLRSMIAMQTHADLLMLVTRSSPGRNTW